MTDLFWKQTICLQKDSDFDLEEILKQIVRFDEVEGNKFSSFHLDKKIAETKFIIGQDGPGSRPIFAVSIRKKMLEIRTDIPWIGYILFFVPLFVFFLEEVLASVFIGGAFYISHLLVLNESKARLIQEFKKHGFVEIEKDKC